MKSAQPKVVGGFLRRKMGAKEAEARRKRRKFRKERRRKGKEEEFLSLEEAMAVLRGIERGKLCACEL